MDVFNRVFSVEVENHVQHCNFSVEEHFKFLTVNYLASYVTALLAALDSVFRTHPPSGTVPIAIKRCYSAFTTPAI